MDEEIIYKISKVLALNDSIGEGYGYNKTYTKK
jgi:hypothetical protein